MPIPVPPSRPFAVRPQQQRLARKSVILAADATKAGARTGGPLALRQGRHFDCPIDQLICVAPTVFVGAGAVNDQTWEELVLNSPIPVLVSRQAVFANPAKAVHCRAVTKTARSVAEVTPLLWATWS